MIHKFFLGLLLTLTVLTVSAEPFPTIEEGRITSVKPLNGSSNWEVLVKDSGCKTCLPIRLKLDGSATIINMSGKQLATEIISASRNKFFSVTYRQANQQIVYMTLLR